MFPLIARLLKRKAQTPSPAPPPALAAVTPLVPQPTSFAVRYAEALAAAAALEFQRAVDLYDAAIALDPQHAEVHYKRGNALKSLGRLDAALASFTAAIRRRPDYAHALCNRGVVQHALGRTADALASYDEAIALDPGDALSHYNRALLMQDLTRWEEAVASYERAIAIDPEYAEAQYNRAVALLFLGHFAEGWRAYEWRWRNAQRLHIGAQRHFNEPLWRGDVPLAGKRLLLYSEAGLGDTLQFCRYATACAARGAIVILEVQPALTELLTRLEGVAEVLEAGSALPAFDLHCALMSLPLAFGTTLANVPAARRYIQSDPRKVAAWQARLGSRSRPRIGLAWSGNPNNTIDSRRSTRLADWIPHLPDAFEYFCLQKDVRDADRATLAGDPRFATLEGLPMDFANTAALCECLDLVITVDTSIAHLSGALGQRTWVLLPFTPDWRWLRDRDDSPWYPTLTLYRQSTPGGWNQVLARMGADLRRHSSG